MSSSNAINWSDGQAVTTEDLNAMANDSAIADDRVSRVLYPPPATGGAAYGKRIMPLFEETSSRAPYQLVVPGATNGRVKTRPFFAEVGEPNISSPNLPDILLAGTLEDELQTPASFANTTTPSQSRIDLVYALIKRGSTQEQREQRDSANQTSLQQFTVRKPLEITLGVQIGTEAVTPSAPSLPADSSSAWYIPLAYVTLVHPYSGGAITQSQITQAWPAAWIPQTRTQRFRPASCMANAYSAGVNGRASTDMSERFGAALSVAANIQHAVNSASWVVIDSNADWRYRIVKVSALRLGATPASTSAAGAPLGSDHSPPLYTHSGATNFWEPTIGTGTPAFRANPSNGALEVLFNFNPPGGFPANTWWIHAEATEQFRQ